MAQQDKVSVNILEKDLTEILTMAKALKEKLMPHLINLTPQDRVELPKIGEKTFNFFDKGAEYVAAYPQLAPTYLDQQALKIDIAAVRITRTLVLELTPLLDALNDTLMAAGSEAYQGLLLYYGSAREAARVNTPNAQSVYDDLSSRFPGAPKKKAAQS